MGCKGNVETVETVETVGVVGILVRVETVETVETVGVLVRVETVETVETVVSEWGGWGGGMDWMELVRVLFWIGEGRFKGSSKMLARRRCSFFWSSARRQRSQ